jgi:MarR family transcriptional regulator, organic hydroperoxide resistance regulator
MSGTRIQETVGYLLARVGRAHRAGVSTRLAEVGLHVGQEMVLVYLWDQDGRSQTELAERLEVEPPTLTRMLSRMERCGFVERRRDPEDGRIFRVYLTPEGRALREPVEAGWMEVEDRAFANLTLEERLLLRRLLLQVRANLKRAPDGPDMY